MELRQLRYFVVLAEELHYGRAAARLYISSPGLSQAIASLERSVGSRLLERAPTVALTEAGMLLAHRARQLLHDADQTMAELRRHADPARGRLTLGLFTGAAAAAELTPLIVQAFLAQYPDVQLELKELDFFTHTQAVLDGAVDVALVRPPLDDDRLDLQTLAVERQVAMLPIGHPLADTSELQVADLLDQVFVGVKDPKLQSTWTDRWDLTEYSNGQRIRHHPSAPRTMSETNLMVASGLSVSTTAESMSRLLPQTGVRYIPITDAAGSPIAVASVRGSAHPLVTAFRHIADRVTEQHLELLPGAVRAPSAG